MAEHIETNRVEVGPDHREEMDSDSKLEEEINAEDPYATSAIFATSEEPTNQEASEKDLNSPDSNDSGIQADAQSYGPLSDDGLYAVIRKPKPRTTMPSAVDRGCVPSITSADESSSIRIGNKTDAAGHLTGDDTENLDDPYATVEVDSTDEEEEEEDPLYAVVRKDKKTLRIVKQDDESVENDDNGNCSRISLNNSSDDIKDDYTEKVESSVLPEGWQKHEDEKGPYYWHVKSGVTQREPPSPTFHTLPAAHAASAQVHKGTSGNAKESTKVPVEADIKLKPGKQNHSQKDVNANRFRVHCLGFVPLTEEELSNDRSGLTINQCIKTLTHCTNIIQPCKLQDRDFYLEFIEDRIVLTCVDTGVVASSESVKSVRVWGVGREEDSRDFAYVSRDPVIERHICWVFTCERTGHEVASALRNVCYKILKEDETFVEKMSSAAAGTRPAALETQVSKEWQRHQAKKWNENVVFPVPMSESKKVINCHYLGMMKVPKALGMEILNDAIEMIYAGVPSSKWVSVSVEVAPSAVTVFDRRNVNAVIFECRIRFLTFLGICINNCKLGAFIMHSAQNEFFAHVFHCTPDAGQFCRTIKAACKLRYQKCLDAQAQKERDRGNASRQTSGRSLPPFQGLKESFQKGVSSLFGGGNNSKQQRKG